MEDNSQSKFSNSSETEEEEEVNIINDDNIEANKEEEIESKDDIRECCLNIFLNFAKISTKNNEFVLSYLEFFKIIKSTNIIKKNLLSQNDIEILLKSTNPTGLNLNSEQFMNFIVRLSNRLNPDDFMANNKQCIVTTVKEHFYPLYNHIQESDGSSYFATKDIQTKIYEIEFDENILFILNNVHTGLSHIYKTYFFYENCNNFHSDIKERSLNDLLAFCKDFKIVPYLTTAEKIGIMYHMCSEMKQEDLTKGGPIYEEDKDMGVFFKLSKFVALLVHIALMSFDKFGEFLDHQRKDINVSANGFDNCAKLILFLERLQSSQCFETVDKFKSKPFTSKMFIVPKIEIIEKVYTNLF
jgi:hypothetical protein